MKDMVYPLTSVSRWSRLPHQFLSLSCFRNHTHTHANMFHALEPKGGDARGSEVKCQGLLAAVMIGVSAALEDDCSVILRAQ